MSYQVFTPFIQLREFDDSGLLLANGWMYFYQAGTSSYGNVYADSTGTTKANPVQLDGAGTAVIYGDPVAYKIVIEDANHVQIFEIDNVFPFGSGAGGTGLGSLAVVLNYNGLRNLTQDYDAVIVCGYAIAGDGGGGLFFQSTSSAGDNNGTILVRASSTRYLRNYSGLIDPRWFGVTYSVAIDQTAALDSATAVGLVQMGGYAYQDRDHHFTGKYSFLPGSGLYTGSGLTPKAYFDTGSKILQGTAGMFGAGLQVNLGQYVTEAIRSSWFNTFEQAEASSTWSYSFLVDADPTIAADIAIPANFAADFVGGAKLPVTGAVRNLSIKNLVYKGTGQIVSYDTLAHVGTVDLAGVPALLEWFGGQEGYTFGINNAIPGKAVVYSGSVCLLSGQSYLIPADGTTWTTGKDLILAGATGAEVLQLNQSVTVQAFTETNCILTGAGTFTAAGAATLKDCSILGVQSRTSASSQDATAAIFVPASLFAAGNGGAAESSSDGVTWSTISGISETVSGPIAQGPIRIVAGIGGKIWKSLDGGQTWASQAVTGFQWWSAYYLQGKYVLVGFGQIAYSTDGTTWNIQAITGASNVLGMAWHSATNLWVATGGLSAGAPGVWSSPDLVTWTNRPLPSGLSTSAQLLTVVAGPSGVLVASGSLSGTILTSSNATTWASLLLPGSDTIYASAASADTIVLTGSTGAIYTSTTNGATWSKMALGSGPIQAATWNAGTFFLGGYSGNTWISTTNAKTWNLSNVGNSNNIQAVALTAPVYAVGGIAGSLQISTDTGAAAWTAVTVTGLSTDITNMRSIGGLVYITAKGGKLFSTVDFQAFRVISTGTTNDLYDIVYNSTAASWTVVGAAGYISTSSNLTSASPTWTGSTAPTSDALIRIIWDGTRYTMATANNVYQTTAIATTATTLAAIAGIVYDGTNWVQYGAGGLIVSSPDLIVWTARTAPAASNILCGFADSTAICLGAASGALFRSTDHGVTWASISTGLTGSVNAIAWNAGISKLGICGTASVSQSSDHGANWASITGTGLTGSTVLLSIWARGSEWDVCGVGGQWAYTTSTTWSQRSTGVSVQLNAGAGDNVVGAAGTTLHITSGSVVNSTASWAIAANLVAIVQNVVLDSTGKAWNTDAALRFMVATDLLDPLVTALAYDGTTLFGVGNTTWTTTAALGFAQWTKLLVHPAGVHDLALISGVLYMVGDAGLYASSPNGVLWTWAGTKYDTTAHFSVAYYQYGELSLGITGVRAFAQGTGAVVIAGLAGSVSSGSGALLPVFSALQINASNVTATVDLTSTNPGSIQSSNLRSVSSVGAVSDSSFSAFHGVLTANVVRATINAIQTIPVTPDVFLVAESSISKLDLYDPSRSILFNFNGSKLQADNIAFNSNGPLHYGVNAGTTITLTNCTSPDNFTQAISNGFAVVNFSSPVSVLNSSISNNNGKSVHPIKLNFGYADLIPTSEPVGNWRNVPAGSSIVGNSLLIGVDTFLHSDVKSGATLRYYGQIQDMTSYLPKPVMYLVKKYGGIISTRFDFPSVMPAGFAPVVTLVQPAMSSDGAGSWAGVVNCGESTKYIYSPNSGALLLSTYGWSGQRDIMQAIGDFHYYDGWGDVELHYIGGGPDPINNAMVVITNQGKGYMPAGTKITMIISAAIPTGRAEYEAFYQEDSQQLIGSPDYVFYFSHQKAFRDSDINGLRTVEAYLYAVTAGALPVTSD